MYKESLYATMEKFHVGVQDRALKLFPGYCMPLILAGGYSKDSSSVDADVRPEIIVAVICYLEPVTKEKQVLESCNEVYGS